MRLLSIDWDYFMNASADKRAMLFPDGGNENLPDYVQDIIWLTRYASSGDELLKVNTHCFKFNEVVKFALSLQSPFPIVVCESHKALYGLVHQIGGITEIVNIDFHHDFYDIGKDVNCGNWGNHLSREGIKIKWVPREDSDMKDGIETLKLSEALSLNYDVVFICRSGMWSPPHLDPDFIKLTRAYGSTTVLSDRSKCYDSNTARGYQSVISEARGGK